MESYLFPSHFDLVTPDGMITSIKRAAPAGLDIELLIQNISPAFIGFHLEKEQISFNLKSTLAQLGLNAVMHSCELEGKKYSATIRLHLQAYGKIGTALLDHLAEGAHLGKLFAADLRRKVRNPDYLLRMFGR